MLTCDLSVAEVEHSYGVPTESSDSHAPPAQVRPSPRPPLSDAFTDLIVVCVVSPQTKAEETDGDPFIMAVTVKNEDGNIDLGTIAESESPIHIYHFLSLSH